MSDYEKLIREHLGAFLERHRKQATLVPQVQRALNEADWQLDAVTFLKAAAPNEIGREIERGLELSYQQVRQSLPLPPEYGTFVFSAVATGVTSSTSAVYDAVRGTLGSPEYKVVAAQHLAKYAELQRQSEREGAIRSALTSRFPTSAVQFDVAANACLVAQADPTQITTAANEIRNLLDRFKGELFQAASGHRGENMTWECMAERLVPGAMPSTTRPIVLFQERVRGRIYGALSETLKRREAVDPAKLDYLWAEAVDHLYVMCAALGHDSA